MGVILGRLIDFDVILIATQTSELRVPVRKGTMVFSRELEIKRNGKK